MYNLEETKMYLENIGLHLGCNAEKVIYSHIETLVKIPMLLCKNSYFLVGTKRLQNSISSKFSKNLCLYYIHLQAVMPKKLFIICNII